MVNNKSKIIFITTTIALAVGSFTLTYWLIKKVTKIRGGIVIKQEYTEPTITEPLTE